MASSNDKCASAVWCCCLWEQRINGYDAAASPTPPAPRRQTRLRLFSLLFLLLQTPTATSSSSSSSCIALSFVICAASKHTVSAERTPLRLRRRHRHHSHVDTSPGSIRPPLLSARHAHPIAHRNEEKNNRLQQQREITLSAVSAWPFSPSSVHQPPSAEAPLIRTAPLPTAPLAAMVSRMR